MEYLASITSKRQLTIPSAVFLNTNLKTGQKVILKQVGNSIVINAASDLVERLAGSVSIPSRFNDLSPNKIVAQAKSEYFKNKYK